MQPSCPNPNPCSALISEFLQACCSGCRLSNLWQYALNPPALWLSHSSPSQNQSPNPSAPYVWQSEGGNHIPELDDHVQQQQLRALPIPGGVVALLEQSQLQLPVSAVEVAAQHVGEDLTVGGRVTLGQAGKVFNESVGEGAPV